MPAASKRGKPSKPAWSEFKVHWWNAADEGHLSRYHTKGASDIRELSATHIIVRAHPRLVPDDGDEPIQIILQCQKGTWSLKLDDYETDYPYHDDDGETAVWTCAHDVDQLVVRGKRRR